MGFVKEKCEKSGRFAFSNLKCKEYHTDNKQYGEYYRESKTVFIPGDSKVQYNYARNTIFFNHLNGFRLSNYTNSLFCTKLNALY